MMLLLYCDCDDVMVLSIFCFQSFALDNDHFFIC